MNEEATISPGTGYGIVAAVLAGVVLLMGGIALFFLVFVFERTPDEYEPAYIVRAEFVRRVISRVEAPAATDEIFTDIPVTHALNAYITSAVHRGVVRPLEEGLEFDPDGDLSADAALMWLSRLLGAGEAGEAAIRAQLPGGWFGTATTRERAADMLNALDAALASLSPAQDEVFARLYHTHVIVFEEPPNYSYIEEGDYFTITVYLADEGIMALAEGDTFVFEPTRVNPSGISGHVTNVHHVVGGAVITARRPLILSEIFIEYEYAAAFYLMPQTDSRIAPAPFTQAFNNPEWISWMTPAALPASVVFSLPGLNAVQVTFNNANLQGVVINGELTLRRPRVYTSLRLTHVEYLTAAAEAEINLTVTAPRETDAFIELFTLKAQHSGVWAEMPVGLRIAADGQFALEIAADLRADFGISGGQGFARVSMGYGDNFEYAHHYTRTQFAPVFQTRVRVLGIPIYGVRAEVGRGFTATDELQELCCGGVCFVVGAFEVLHARSLTGWGSLRNSAALRFNENLAEDVLYDIWYIYRGAFRRFCPHPPAIELVEEDYNNNAP